MLIKTSPGWVSSHLFGEAGAVFRASPVASLLKGNDPRRDLPELWLRRAPWVKRNYLAFPGSTSPAGSGMPRTSLNPHLSLGMFQEFLVGLAADVPSAFIPGHRSHCKNLIIKKGTRKKTGKQGISVISILQQLATV